MANVVLTLTNHIFAPSIWSAWANAPYDLVLATEVSFKVQIFVKKNLPQDGSIGAHCGMLLPLSRYLASVLGARPFTGPTQVATGLGMRLLCDEISFRGGVDEH